ncbi:MAG: 2,3-bisphosphoglycerate-independent phosphoglycerate mutase [Desulfobacteraceae bacterium]|nr:2,3-bisphosphoglycerate-independent phosphoglycerate mutase [Desulfobacteraceae bacterium]MBC2755338.1 2,3-bisphosphoglycerate-independent phosphoglycerate mutase [Desulfobacteraceae bacterium]
MKLILVLLDGVGDRSYDVLNHQTPLEAANTPNMDRLATIGSTGLFHASSLGECLPSEMAHFLLFGYDRENFPGRGLLEAVGEKVPFGDSDVLALAHFSGVLCEQGGFVLDRGRDDIPGSKEDLRELFLALESYEDDDIRFRLYQTRRNDGIIVISGKVSPYISDSDPIACGKKIGRVLALHNNPEPVMAKQTADALNRYLTYCYHNLSCNNELCKKANFLVTQRCGRRVVQKPFASVWGLKPMMIASVSVYEGLAHELGFDFVKAEDGEKPGQDLEERIRLALDDSDHDFFHVHTKVPDEISHKGTPMLKKQALEDIDRGLGELVGIVEQTENVMVIVTGDHSTPSGSSHSGSSPSCSKMIHSGETVPVVIAGPNVRRDRVDRFDEISVATGCLGLLRGRELMQMALNFADQSVLATLQLGDTVNFFVPDDYPPFILK